jgi:hypothetical protein
MVNSIKKGGDDELRLQVTTPARHAGLVEENEDGDAIRLSPVYVYGFDGVILAISQSVDMGHRAELVSTAAGDTGSMHGGYPATVAEAGNGYQVNLPGGSEAGFRVGDNAPVVASDGVMIIHDVETRQIAEQLSTKRDEQVSSKH